MGRDLTRVGPHGSSHLVALRAGVSVLVPLAVVVLLGRLDWAAYAGFGAFTSLYGRHSHWSERAGMQASAAVCLVASVGLGVLVSGQGLTPWLVVAGGALVAAWGSLTSDAFGWHPPGPLFMVFAFAVCAYAAPGASALPEALAVASLSAAHAMLVGHVGWLADPESWQRPVLPVPRFRQVAADPAARRHVLRFFLATAAAGTIGTLLGGVYPYWAMVAAAASLGGPHRRARYVRGLHRVVGTLAGVAVAWPVLALRPTGLMLVVVIAALQIGAELLVGRNYALALLFITPLALAMGQLVSPAPLEPLLVDRAVETVIGFAVAALVMETVRDRRAPA